MSALLRALMAQQSGEDKPNLAVIAESTVSTDALGKRTFTHSGVTANLKKGIDYYVEFDFEMNFTESSGEGLVQLGNYLPWGNNGIFFSASVTNSTQTITRHINMIVHSIGNVSDKETGLMIWTVSNKKGSLHISNLVITEV